LVWSIILETYLLASCQCGKFYFLLSPKFWWVQTWSLVFTFCCLLLAFTV
jgi:hypothetical protein